MDIAIDEVMKEHCFINLFIISFCKLSVTDV